MLIGWQNAIAYRHLGDLDAANREVDAILRWLSVFGQAGQAFATPGLLAMVGRDEEARKVLEQLEERYASGDRFRGAHIFVAYFYLGDLDRTFIWLNRSIENRETEEFASLRDYPRYQAAIKRIDGYTIRR